MRLMRVICINLTRMLLTFMVIEAVAAAAA